MNCELYEDLVGADVDGALGADERTAVDAHLRACATCRDLRVVQLGIRDRIRGLPRRSAPPELRDRLLRTLDEERQPDAGKVVALRSNRRFLIVGAVAAALALMFLPVGRWSHPELIGLLVHDAQAAEIDDIALAARATDPTALREYFAGEHLGFENTVPDLSHRGFAPVGSVIDRTGPTPAAITVFRGEHGTVVCRRYRFDAVQIPDSGERIGQAVVVTRDGVTMRFVRDGDALCGVASTMPRERFLAVMGLVRP